jgi:uncharacterized protein involved in type VI secretion and phage assembly
MAYAFENQIIKVPIGNTIHNIKLIAEKYQNGRLAILGICDDGEEFSVLTTNFPSHSHMLKENQTFIKDWSENEQFAQAALKSGFFKDTGSTIPSGFVQVKIWEVLHA